MDRRARVFQRYLTRESLFIGWSAADSIEPTAFNSRRWVWGLPILKVWWMDEGPRLSPGFLISGRRAAQLEALDALRREHTV